MKLFFKKKKKKKLTCNWILQMNPSFSGKLLERNDLSLGELSKIGLQDEGCPPGMVPIQRIKSNLRNANSPSKSHLGNFHRLTTAYTHQHVSYLHISKHCLLQYG